MKNDLKTVVLLRPCGYVSHVWRGKFKVCERGVLVKPGDAEGFAKGLHYLLEHPDVCEEMGIRGRTYAMKHHGKERLAADMDRLYRSLSE